MPATAQRAATAQPLQPARDRLENFHGQQLLYVLWERHLIICAPIALALPPDLPFEQLVQQVLPGTVFAQHPDWQRLADTPLEWHANGQRLNPQPGQTLAELGLGHKTLLRLRTPALTGLAGVNA